MTTGERIRMIRKEKGMNQTEFAKEIAVSTTTVCQLETGRYNIARTTKKILCERFGISENWLDTGEGNMYATIDTAEGVAPYILSMLRDNPEMLEAVRKAIRLFTMDDWYRLCTVINVL